MTSCWDSEEEARAIGEEIEALQRDDGCGKAHSLDEIAILVRASFQMREFEDRFVTLGSAVSRALAGRASTSARRSATRWLIFASCTPRSDDLAFERIVNVPKRGLGDATVQMLHEHARKRRIPLSAAAAAVIADRRAQA